MLNIVNMENGPSTKAFGTDDVAEEDLHIPCESVNVASDLLIKDGVLNGECNLSPV